MTSVSASASASTMGRGMQTAQIARNVQNNVQSGAGARVPVIPTLTMVSDPTSTGGAGAGMGTHSAVLVRPGSATVTSSKSTTRTAASVPPAAAASSPVTPITIANANANNTLIAAWNNNNNSANTNRRSSMNSPAGSSTSILTSRTNSNSNSNNRSTTTATSTTTTTETTTNTPDPHPRRTSTSSQSIHVHAELFMQLIHEERALASLSVRAEVEALRRELEEREREVLSLRGELEDLRRVWAGTGAGASVQQRGASASASSPTASSPSAHSPASGSYGSYSDIRLLHYELENKRKEIEALKKVLEEGKAARGELAVLKSAFEAVSGEHRKACGELHNLRRENVELRRMISGSANANANPGVRVKMEEGVEQDIGNINPNPNINPNANPNADAEALRRRCEELGSENDRLRRSEAILRQRIEIFESLSASASNALPSLDHLPDLNYALEALIGHRSNSTTDLNDVHAKKRRLDEMRRN